MPLSVCNSIEYLQKPFHLLPSKKRAVYILHLAGFTVRDISRLLRTPRSTISDYIQEGCEKYNLKNRTRGTISGGVRILYVGSSAELEAIEGKHRITHAGGEGKATRIYPRRGEI